MSTWEKPIIDPKIKKEINDEGFEDNAAVLIGKKEDMPQLEEKLETEGRAVDLASYIKLNKIIEVPADELGDLETKDPQGAFWINRSYYGPILHYIDKDGNLAKVEILNNKTASLPEYNSSKDEENIVKAVKKELVESGFKEMDNSLCFKASSRLGMYNKKIMKEMEDRKKEEFNF